MDLEYPAELHEEHKSNPLAPEVVKADCMSDYQKNLRDKEVKPLDSEKLLLSLENKNKYVVHYENLQFHLKQGMKLKCVHRVLDGAVHLDIYTVQRTTLKRTFTSS